MWYYCTTHMCPCKLVEQSTAFGRTVCRIWLPSTNSVVVVPASTLSPIASQDSKFAAENISYISAAAKVAEVLEGSTHANGNQILLAPMESNVIPLPHQIHVLSRAMSNDQVRYLLADEVGLGKTIEAGLIMRELKLRGLVRRKHSRKVWGAEIAI